MHRHDPLDDSVEHAWQSAVWRRQNAWDIPLGEPLTLKLIWTVYEHLLVTRYLIVASFALGFYDYFLTLPKERTFVWRSRPSVVRSIYFFVRYSYFPIGVFTLYGECCSTGAGAIVSRAHRPSNVPRNLPYLYRDTILPLLAHMRRAPFIQSLSLETLPTTDRLFNSTEKTGSAPPGGLNNTVSLTHRPLRSPSPFYC